MRSILSLIFFTYFLSVCYYATGQQQIRQIMEGFPSVLDKPSDFEHPDAKVLEPGLFNHIRPLMELYSPENEMFVGAQDGNLYARKIDSENYLWSLEPQEGFKWSMDNALWSPKGNYFVAKQIDDRKVPAIKLISTNPEQTTYKKYSRAGQNIPIHNFYIIDHNAANLVKIEFPSNLPYVHMLSWNEKGDKIYSVAADRLLKELHLQTIDPQSGEITSLLVEKADTYVEGLNLLPGYSNRLRNKKLMVLLETKSQFTWMSERSGYNQIYLYDTNGKLIRPLTNYSENGIVTYLEYIDEENGWLYFLAHNDANKPYEHQLYKTSLNNPKIIKILDEPGIMEVHAPINKDTLWVMRSQLPRTLQIDRYSSDGDYYDTPWEGNFSGIEENHFNYEYVKAKAADNETDLYTLILKPSNFDSSKNYPVVEYIYGGNFMNVVPYHLLNPSLWEMNSLAQEGFIVIFIDGRGTSDRGKAFQDYSYGKFGQVELEDHLSVITQIAKNRPYMNMEQVGILGHSWGGHFALRALVEAPDFYKAGHISAPALEPSEFRIPIEIFMGCLPQDCPEKYKESSIVDKLATLKAPLMIIHGTNDDDVPIEDSYKLSKLLDEMNYENYKFISYKGMDHIVMKNREWLPTMIQFFTEHLK